MYNMLFLRCSRFLPEGLKLDSDAYSDLCAHYYIPRKRELWLQGFPPGWCPGAHLEEDEGRLPDLFQEAVQQALAAQSVIHEIKSLGSVC